MRTHPSATTRLNGRSAAIRRTGRLRATLVGAALAATLAVSGGLGFQLASATTSATTPTVIHNGKSSKVRHSSKPLVSPSRGGSPQATTKGS